VELGPKKRVRVVEVAKGREIPSDDPAILRWVREAIAYYQVASGVVRRMP